MPTTTIATNRLILRSPLMSDAASQFALFNDWSVVEWLSAPPWPYFLADMSSFLERMIAGTAADDEKFLVITEAGDARGGISYRMRPANRLQSGAGPNVGYWLGKPHWGRGLMTEAVGGLAGHIFATTGADAIYSSAFTGNTASLHVQTKIGFVRYGETTLRSNPQNAELPLIKTVLTRSAFETSNPRKTSLNAGHNATPAAEQRAWCGQLARESSVAAARTSDLAKTLHPRRKRG